MLGRGQLYGHTLKEINVIYQFLIKTHVNMYSNCRKFSTKNYLIKLNGKYYNTIYIIN